MSDSTDERASATTDGPQQDDRSETYACPIPPAEIRPWATYRIGDVEIADANVRPLASRCSPGETYPMASTPEDARFAGQRAVREAGASLASSGHTLTSEDLWPIRAPDAIDASDARGAAEPRTPDVRAPIPRQIAAGLPPGGRVVNVAPAPAGDADLAAHPLGWVIRGHEVVEQRAVDSALRKLRERIRFDSTLVRALEVAPTQTLRALHFLAGEEKRALIQWLDAGGTLFEGETGAALKVSATMGIGSPRKVFALPQANITWSQADSQAILMNRADRAWNAGRANDVLVTANSNLLVATDTGGVWLLTSFDDTAKPLSNYLPPGHIHALAQGATDWNNPSQDHVYAGGDGLWETDTTSGDALNHWVQVRSNISLGTIYRIVCVTVRLTYETTADLIVVACDIGVLWAYAVGASKLYTWQRAVGPGGGLTQPHMYTGLTLLSSSYSEPTATFLASPSGDDSSLRTPNTTYDTPVAIVQWSPNGLVMSVPSGPPRDEQGAAIDASATEFSCVDAQGGNGALALFYHDATTNYRWLRGIWYSSDAGNSWKMLSGTVTNTNPTELWSTSGPKAAGLEQSGALFPATSGPIYGAIALSPDDPTTVAFGAVAGAFVYTAAAGKWTLAGYQTPHLHADIHAVRFFSGGQFAGMFVCSDGGVAHSPDLGTTWDSRINRTLLNLQFDGQKDGGNLSGAWSYPGLLAAGLQDNDVVYAQLATSYNTSKLDMWQQAQTGNDGGLAIILLHGASTFLLAAPMSGSYGGMSSTGADLYLFVPLGPPPSSEVSGVQHLQKVGVAGGVDTMLAQAVAASAGQYLAVGVAFKAGTPGMPPTPATSFVLIGFKLQGWEAQAQGAWEVIASLPELPTCCASIDGRTIWVAGDSGDIYYWDGSRVWSMGPLVAGGKTAAFAFGPNGETYALCNVPASSSSPGLGLVFESAPGGWFQDISSGQITPRSLVALAVAPDGRVFAAGAGADGYAHVYMYDPSSRQWYSADGMGAPGNGALPLNVGPQYLACVTDETGAVNLYLATWGRSVWMAQLAAPTPGGGWAGGGTGVGPGGGGGLYGGGGVWGVHVGPPKPSPGRFQ